VGQSVPIHFFVVVGFESCRTNEHNICLTPENIFMARIGKNVSSKEQDRFKWMRFGIT